MLKTQRIKMFIGLLLLAFVAVSAACSSAPAKTAQTPRVKPAESPTPAYKPLKRVSRDVIKSETKEEVVKAKTK